MNPPIYERKIVVCFLGWDKRFCFAFLDWRKNITGWGSHPDDFRPNRVWFRELMGLRKLQGPVCRPAPLLPPCDESLISPAIR